MNRDRFQSMVSLMWLSLPTAAWQYWRAWDHLPAGLAVHFDRDWRPNGYHVRAQPPHSELARRDKVLCRYSVGEVLHVAGRSAN